MQSTLTLTVVTKVRSIFYFKVKSAKIFGRFAKMLLASAMAVSTHATHLMHW